ncbi:uncharacterized protein Z520_08569 [Fonsecaea multimorphosa CBS 102226]|uniref:Zn(2)-C6 fungal-type domain-containing protein n=1 Tax=Fonsecaea multimorphosa CBS 102226 TaxID=1442371 RepID=A0A0D2IFI1_9EURO|nr:uncharacterized protein Z520_08569 [Fonsecaea multimorphosa CBS 102226]KIX95861.1 hypothetical protein Z520_08569 [Fonsecaea multimorphosa CBS 102226]
MARASTACQRCRRRKQKCDLKYPSCSNCESANVACLTYDARKQAEVGSESLECVVRELTSHEIPRTYVSQLEAQVQKLTQEVRDLRTQTRPPEVTHREEADIEFSAAATIISPEASTTSSPESNRGARDLVKSVRNVLVEPSKQPRFLGPSSGITLARMVMASIKVDALRQSPTSGVVDQLPDMSGSGSSALAAEASLPPRHAADHLVEVYFQYRTPHLPIIRETKVKRAIDNAYACMSGGVQPLDRQAEKDVFTTYMVFAIALCNVPSPTGGTGRPLQSEGCFHSAINWVESVITYAQSDLETLRALLLLAQFVSMCPWRGSLWHLSGMALRMCVDMGLHWESDEQQLSSNHDQDDQDVLYERRQLWYSAYYLDHLLGITLGRPFGITDESTRVPLPNPWAVSGQPFGVGPTEVVKDFENVHQRAHNHLFKMTQLESEIKHVQQSQTWSMNKMAYPRPNYRLWVNDIQARLQEWYSTVPNTTAAHPSSIFAHEAYWEAMYNHAILLLYRPNSSSLIQHLPSDTFAISFDASCKLIASIKLLQREGRLDVLWKAVYDLFMAGLTVIYCVWQSASIRSQHPASKIIATLQSCVSTLSAMSANFAGASESRDAFETLSTATTDWLLTSGSGEPSRNRATFESQIGDLLGSLQPSRRSQTGAGVPGRHANWNDLSTMLSSSDTFAFDFGDMLSSAAQWPDIGDVDFNDMMLDSASATASDVRAYERVFGG